MSLNPVSRSVTGRVVLVCGAITAGAGALALVGWALGSDTLTAMGTGYIPMAPNTALLFVLLGCAVLVREVWPASKLIHRAVVAAALVSALVGSVTLAGFVTGLNIDGWLFRTTRMLGAVPIGRMALVTACCFVLAGVSLFLVERQARTGAAILGILVALAGTVCLTGYWFGSPLFYGGNLIPVALPTSLALVALGVALIAAARPDPWPLNALIGASTLAVFAMDWLTPLGYAEWLLYLIPLLLTRWTPQPRNPVVLAAICTVLVIVGFFLSPQGIDTNVAIFNRGLSVAVLWLTAVLLAKGACAETALRAGEERYRTLFESMDEGFCVVEMIRDAHGKAVDYRFLEINPAFMRQTGLTDALTKTMREMVPNHDEHWFEIYGKVARTGEAIRFENPAVAMGRHYDVFAFRIGGDGSQRVGIMFNDITTRKRTEVELHRSEESFRSLFENMLEGVAYCRMIFDDGDRLADFVYLKVNSSFERLTGLKNVVGKKETEVFPGVKELHPEMFEIFGRVALTGKPEQFEIDFKPLKQVFFLSVYSMEKGHCILTFDNITERKRAEAAVRESEEQFRETFYRAGVAKAQADPVTARFLRVNPAFCKFLGYTEAELLRKTFLEITLPEEREAEGDLYPRLLRGEIPTYAREKHYIRKDGTLVWGHLSVTMLFDHAGRANLVTAVVQDITERKQAEEALRESEAKFRAIIESSPVAMAVNDEHGNITFLNRKFVETFGFTLADIPTLAAWWPRAYPDPVYRQRVAQEWQGAVDKAQRDRTEFEPLEYKVTCQDGTVRDIRFSMSPMGASNLVIFYDITERKRAEEALRELSVRLSRAEEEERRRIARELHDSTGQKLAALSMNVGLIQDATSAPDGKTEKMFADCLATIEQCAQEIRTHSYLLHPPLLDELGLAAAIADYVTGFAKRSGVRVALDAPPDFERLPGEVELALFRVVQESLGNIHRHAGAATARIRLACDAEQVTLEVSDQGGGMSAETLRAVEAGHGPAGVGIAGMRERLRLLGGRLEIESGGQGTTVRAVVPRREEKAGEG